MALQVPNLAAKAARSLPRYTDIIVADVGKLILYVLRFIITILLLSSSDYLLSSTV